MGGDAVLSSKIVRHVYLKKSNHIIILDVRQDNTQKEDRGLGYLDDNLVFARIRRVIRLLGGRLIAQDVGHLIPQLPGVPGSVVVQHHPPPPIPGHLVDPGVFLSQIVQRGFLAPGLAADTASAAWTIEDSMVSNG